MRIGDQDRSYSFRGEKPIPIDPELVKKLPEMWKQLYNEAFENLREKGNTLNPHFTEEEKGRIFRDLWVISGQLPKDIFNKVNELNIFTTSDNDLAQLAKDAAHAISRSY